MNYYPHHIGDFNSATRHLTRVERSLYRDLIELYYDTEQPLPADDFDRLARRVIAVSEEEKAALRYVLEEFFELDGDAYRHSRCDEEIEKYQANSSAKAKAGKASAEARKRKAEAAKSRNQEAIEQNPTGVEQPLSGCATNQEPRTSNQEPLKPCRVDDAPTGLAIADPPKKRFVAKAMDLPPAVDRSAWERWCEFRSSKRKPVSEQAASQQINLLSRYPPDVQAAMVQNSIQNDYQGLFEPKGGSNGNGQISQRDRERAALREATLGETRNDW